LRLRLYWSWLMKFTSTVASTTNLYGSSRWIDRLMRSLIGVALVVLVEGHRVARFV